MTDRTHQPMHRFYAPTLDPGDDMATLSRDEAEHLTRVLRLGAGDLVTVFDGRGNEFVARVMAPSPRVVRVQILSRLEPARESDVSITLVQAVLKGDRMDDVVRDAVMLGVTAIQPIVTTRTQVTVAQLLRGARPERWQRVALASTKQCGRALLPEVRLPLALETYLNEPLPAVSLMLVEPRSHPDPGSFAAIQEMPRPQEVVILVGPEGGWTETECAAAAQSGIRLLTLGGRTLRADAAPVAALSILEFIWSTN